MDIRSDGTRTAWGAAGLLMTLAILAILATPALAQNGFQGFARSADDQYGAPAGTQAESGEVRGGQSASTGRGESTRRGSRGRGRDRDGSGSGGSGRDGRGAGSRDVSREQAAPLPLRRPQGGQLPFTGFGLMTLALVGALLIAVGMAARAAARARLRQST